MRNGQVTVNNRQVIAVFVLGVALLLAAFWAGLNVVKQDSIAAPSHSSNAVLKGSSESAQKANATRDSSIGQPPEDVPYLVRVAAYGTAERANQLTNELRKKYQSAYTQNPDSESSLYRVNIGPYDSRREATLIADELILQGLKSVTIVPWKQN
jgi:cell division septation protein DedD